MPAYLRDTHSDLVFLFFDYRRTRELADGLGDEMSHPACAHEFVVCIGSVFEEVRGAPACAPEVADGRYTAILDDDVQASATPECEAPAAGSAETGAARAKMSAQKFAASWASSPDSWAGKPMGPPSLLCAMAELSMGCPGLVCRSTIP